MSESGDLDAMPLPALADSGPAGMLRHQPMPHMGVKSETLKVDGEHQQFPFSSVSSLVTPATVSVATTLPFVRLTPATGADPSPDSVHTISQNVTT